ncbi:MAG: tetratricopeptide repeat protein [Pseudomonadota bacterium]
MIPLLSSPSLAVYNPDLLSDEVSARQFVARLGLLSRLLEDLRAPEGPQHHLVIGQRGMGKTTLLRRMGGAIREDASLSERWLPLAFPEEQYNVTRLSDLWANCLDALSDALEQAGGTGEAAAIDALVDALPAAPEPARAQVALDALLRWTEQHRGVVLLLDNVDLLLERLAEHHWALREVLSRHPRLCFMGASTGAPDGLTRYEDAFYDFFCLHELRGLSLEEAQDVVLRLAEIHDTPHVAEVVRGQPGRFHALHVLTGGNPRTLVLLYQVLAHGDSDTVHVDLERLLDACTPLYKARFEALPIQSQQVMDALALGWDPQPAAEVAAAARLDVNSVSSQLARLVRDGLVEKTPLPYTERTGFLVSERFFNVWYLMRASRRLRRRLVWLVRFLELFYGPESLPRQARSLLGRAHGRRGAELSLAYACAVADRGLARALELRGVDLLLGEEGGARKQLRELLDLDGEDKPIADIAERKAALAEARKNVLAAPVDWEKVGCTAEEFWGLLGGSPSISVEQKTTISAAISGPEPGLMGELLSGLHEEAEDARRRIGPAGWTAMQSALSAGNMSGTDDVVGAEATVHLGGPEVIQAIALAAAFEARALTQEETQAWASLMVRCEIGVVWVDWAQALSLRLGRHEEAERAFRRAIDLAPGEVTAWRGLGNLLGDRLGRPEDAIRAYRRALEIDSHLVEVWITLLRLLSERLGRHEEALSEVRAAIASNPDRALLWLVQGFLLHDAFRQRDQAEASLRRAIELDPTGPLAWRELGRLLAEEPARLQLAREALREAIRLDGGNADHLNDLAWLIFEMSGDQDEAETLARRAAELEPNEPNFHHTLACILARRGDWPGAEKAARRYLTLGDETYHQDNWPDALRFFREAVLTNHAPEAAAALDDLNLSERWHPLRQALEAVVRGRPDHTLGLAPEVREATGALLDQLWPPEERPQPAPQKRRRGSRRR